MNILTVDEITKAYGERKIFDKASFFLQEGEKAGILGINGTGKTTLLRMIVGEDEPDEGQIIRAKGKVISFLPQNPFFDPDENMLSAVLHSPTAIQVSIRIMNAFVQLRHYVSSQIVKTDDKAELAEIRRLLLLHIDHCDKKFSEQDEKINQIIKVLNNLIDEPNTERKIGFVYRKE